MADLAKRTKQIAKFLGLLLDRHGVPGASVAVFEGDDYVEFAAGTAELRGKQAVTPDTLFQIGSVTKVFTATLVLQLVDRGLVDLDEPVGTYLPEAAANPAFAEVTVRHLLSHCNGIDGDLFADVGSGPDAVARLAETLFAATPLFTPGTLYSYSNAGFVLAGRLVEVVTGTPYADAVKALVAPLGGTTFATTEEEALQHPVAFGHGKSSPDAPLMRLPFWAIAPGCAPAGSQFSATARDLVAFARMHLDDGRAPDGTEILSPGLVKAMQERQLDLPVPGDPPKAIGLGWHLETRDGERVITHGGTTPGHRATLEVFPDRRAGFAVLLNSTEGDGLQRDLARLCEMEVFGLTPDLPPAPAAPQPALDLAHYTGVYEAAGMTATVEAVDGRLMVAFAPSGLIAELRGEGPPPRPLPAVDENVFLLRMADDDEYVPVSFIEPDAQGRRQFFFMGSLLKRQP